jgi:hypothetical protein
MAHSSSPRDACTYVGMHGEHMCTAAHAPHALPDALMPARERRFNRPFREHRRSWRSMWGILTCCLQRGRGSLHGLLLANLWMALSFRISSTSLTTVSLILLQMSPPVPRYRFISLDPPGVHFLPSDRLPFLADNVGDTAAPCSLPAKTFLKVCPFLLTAIRSLSQCSTVRLSRWLHLRGARPPPFFLNVLHVC